MSGQRPVADQPAVKANLHAIINPTAVPRARSAVRRFADRGTTDHPLASPRDDFFELLTSWH